MDNRVVLAITVRRAVEEDAAAVVGIYAPYVEQTAISFEEIVPTADEMAARITKCCTRWQWLVAENRP